MVSTPGALISELMWAVGGFLAGGRDQLSAAGCAVVARPGDRPQIPAPKHRGARFLRPPTLGRVRRSVFKVRGRPLQPSLSCVAFMDGPSDLLLIESVCPKI